MPGPSVGVQSRLPDTDQRNDIESHSAQMLRFAARTRFHATGTSLHAHEPTSDVRGTLRLACRSRTSDTA